MELSSSDSETAAGGIGRAQIRSFAFPFSNQLNLFCFVSFGLKALGREPAPPRPPMRRTRFSGTGAAVVLAEFNAESLDARESRIRGFDPYPPRPTTRTDLQSDNGYSEDALRVLEVTA